MTKSLKKKEFQLGMPVGTAAHKLRKMIMFSLVQKLKLDFCFQCGTRIESSEDLSIEHKKPYLDSEDPRKLFFDLDNIAFSHLECNVKAARPKEAPHGKLQRYKNGCRCNECTEGNAKHKRDWRKSKKEKSSLASSLNIHVE